MVERALSMREVKGSMPFFSTQLSLSTGYSGPVPSSTLGVLPLGGISSNGRAGDSHSPGKGIDAPILHSKFLLCSLFARSVSVVGYH